MMTRKQINEAIEERDYKVLFEKILFGGKAALYVILFVFSMLYLWWLNKYYVVPRIGSGNTDMGIAYGCFIVCVFYVCYQCINQCKTAMDYNIYYIMQYYNGQIVYAEALKIAYNEAYSLEFVDIDIDDDTESEEIVNAMDSIESIPDDYIDVPDFELTDEELGIVVFS